jgi:hypothetical protein
MSSHLCWCIGNIGACHSFKATTRTRAGFDSQAERAFLGHQSVQPITSLRPQEYPLQQLFRFCGLALYYVLVSCLYTDESYRDQGTRPAEKAVIVPVMMQYGCKR